jgi:hypothetical protein
MRYTVVNGIRVMRDRNPTIAVIQSYLNWLKIYELCIAQSCDCIPITFKMYMIKIDGWCALTIYDSAQPDTSLDLEGVLKITI